MKLLYLANLRLPTEKAYGIQIAKMCEAFIRSGVQVTLLIPWRKNQIQQSIQEYYSLSVHIPVKKIWCPDFYFPGSFDRIAVFLKNMISGLILAFTALRMDPHIIFSRDEWPLFFLSFFRNRLVFEAHRFSGLHLPLYWWFKVRRVEVITITKGLQNEFLRFGFDQNSVLVAPDGVDLEQFDINISKKDARANLELPQESWLVGYVGQLKTLGMSKGLDALIEGFSIFHQNNPKSILVIVGGSPYDVGYYKEYTRRNGLSQDSILFTGRQPYHLIPQYLKSFDILVMSYPNERHYTQYMSPLKLFEYMASKRPIVATDLPSVQEVIGDREAFFWPPGKPDALADLLMYIFSHENEARAKIEAAFRAVQKYSWRERAQRILTTAQGASALPGWRLIL